MQPHGLAPPAPAAPAGDNVLALCMALRIGASARHALQRVKGNLRGTHDTRIQVKYGPNAYVASALSYKFNSIQGRPYVAVNVAVASVLKWIVKPANAAEASSGTSSRSTLKAYTVKT